MVSKSELKHDNKKLQKRIKRLERLVKIGIKSINDRDRKIIQLASILEQQQISVSGK